MRFYLLISLFLFATAIHAQRCKVREGYSPVSDTTSWIFGKKDRLQIYVDKANTKEVFLVLSVLTVFPTNLMTSVEDSVTFLLKNEQLIKLSNCKNTIEKRKKMFAIFAVLDFGFLIYVLPLTHSDLKKLTESKIRSFSITIQTAINSYSGNLNLKKIMIANCTNIAKSDDKIYIDLNAGQRNRKAMIRSASCALKYIN